MKTWYLECYNVATLEITPPFMIWIPLNIPIYTESPESPEGKKKEKGSERTFEELRAKTPKCDERHEALTQEAQWTPK